LRMFLAGESIILGNGIYFLVLCLFGGGKMKKLSC
jgi:hypothetical protein